MTLDEILELVGPLDESAGENTAGTTQLARARRKSP